MMEEFLVESEPCKPRTFKIHGIEEFIRIVTWISGDGKVIFRGQREDKPLIPSVGRKNKHKNWLIVEKESFEEFKREAVPYLDFTPANDWQWLAVAQHNRLPTRLLDWNQSPLAALWFTVCESSHNKKKPGVVWCYSYGQSNVIGSTTNLPSNFSDPFSLKNSFLYFPEHVFPYIQAQSGTFTIHHKDEDKNKFVALENTKNSDLFLIKILIPAESFPTLRYHLFSLGITPSVLFPGLYGLVERIKYQNEICKDEIKSNETT